MKVLVIGSGGREYALCWKLAQSSSVKEIYCAPGNGGTDGLSKCSKLDISATNIDALVKWAVENEPDLTIVGPEAPLCAGIVDQWPKDLRIFGPNESAARLEGSKIYARKMMDMHDVPQPEWKAFREVSVAEQWLMRQPEDKPWVVKADGLAAGKGVLMCKDRAEAIQAIRMMADFGEAGRFFIIEECLTGVEASLFLLCGKAGQTIPLETARDYKRAGDGDTGLNTGGMGAYSPADYLTSEMIADIIEKLQPMIREVGFTGSLYVGLMLTAEGWKVLEFNVRLGDPETQVILPRLESDLFRILYTMASVEIWSEPLIWYKDVCVTVVLTVDGYPDKYQKGQVISGLESASKLWNVTMMHAGTTLGENNVLLTNGGRVLNSTAIGMTREDARQTAYVAAGYIHWPGMPRYRNDIAR